MVMAAGVSETILSSIRPMAHIAPVCEDRCPLCGQANACCRAFGGDPAPAPCWCESITIPPDVLAGIPAALRGKSCLCHSCSHPDGGLATRSAEEVEDDAYFTEDGRMVFTRAYHLRRGHCCGSGCRHCPFDPPVSRP